MPTFEQLWPTWTEFISATIRHDVSRLGQICAEAGQTSPVHIQLGTCGASTLPAAFYFTGLGESASRLESIAKQMSRVAREPFVLVSPVRPKHGWRRKCRGGGQIRGCGVVARERPNLRTRVRNSASAPPALSEGRSLLRLPKGFETLDIGFFASIGAGADVCVASFRVRGTWRDRGVSAGLSVSWGSESLAEALSARIRVNFGAAGAFFFREEGDLGPGPPTRLPHEHAAPAFVQIRALSVDLGAAFQATLPRTALRRPQRDLRAQTRAQPPAQRSLCVGHPRAGVAGGRSGQ